MFDTHITVVGTALTAPESKLLEKSGAVVASFRVISNARRFNKELNQWVDSSNLRIRVTCWRRLASHVVSSVRVGDAVIVHGRIVSRDWTTEQGEARLSYEVEADTVGHDLSRGLAEFKRIRVDAVQSVIEDEESEKRISGERAYDLPASATLAMAAPAANAGAVPGGAADETDPSFDDFGYGDLGYADGVPEPVAGAVTVLQQAGLDPRRDGEDDGASGDAGDDEGDKELVGAGVGGPGGRGRRRGK